MFFHILLFFFALSSNLVSEASTTTELYAKTEESVFTIEVHTGNADTKSSLGSGYLISKDGLIATNYHVIGEYIKEPSRYSIRVRHAGKQHAATLHHFDFVNDLAILRVIGLSATPLELNDSLPAPGSSIVSLGNPHGLRLSIIEGVFNGFADKGLIDRMLLSMPLNSGMSGGPILDRHGKVIGTNVSIYLFSNNVSFGVPIDKLKALLLKPALANTRAAYQQAMLKQMQEIEKQTFVKVSEAMDSHSPLTIGGAQIQTPAKIFECWDSGKDYKKQGLKKSLFSCNLQFTPVLEDEKAVASIDILVEHLETTKSSYGFYGYLTEHGDNHHDVSRRATTDSNYTSPHCSTDRVTIDSIEWKMNTCVNGYTDYPGLYDFAMVANTLGRVKEAIYIGFHLNGFTLESFKALSQAFLKTIHFSGDAQP